VEKRVVPAGEIEVRAEGEVTKLAGYAVKWNSESAGLPFVEVFRQGAFAESLDSNIVALWAHDSAKPLASTGAGNLKIQEDNIGLYFEMTPLETTWGKDALTSIANRVVSGMSFGFSVVDDIWGLKDGQSYRDVTKAKLYEISPTPFPAYPETSVSARGIFYNTGIDFDRLSNILTTEQRNSPLTEVDCDLINDTIKIIQSYLPAKRENKQQFVLMRKRLELLEKII
jgi:hypothetical protein